MAELLAGGCWDDVCAFYEIALLFGENDLI